MDPLTKTYFSMGLVVVAAFNFWTAMQVFGKQQNPKNPKLLMRLHRIGGYVFLVYFIWVSWICVDLMARLSRVGKPLDVRGFYHGFLAFAMLAILLLKISFIRVYSKFRNNARTLGIIVTVGTVVIWSIAGGMFLILAS